MESNLLRDLLTPTYSTYVHILSNKSTCPFNDFIECVDIPGADVASSAYQSGVDNTCNCRLERDLQCFAAHTKDQFS